MSQIHQLVHTLSYGDAISGEVITLQRCLRALGFESEIFCINTHPHYHGKTRSYKDLSTDFTGEIVLHYSLGSPLNEVYRSARGALRTLVYHNITPARWFQGVNPKVVHDIENGIKELPELCGLSDRILADSPFNADEIRALGFQAQVLELPIDAEKWSVARNEGIYNLVKNDPGVHLLHVGRLAPNKKIEDIIKAFYFYHYHIERSSKLWLVGIDHDTEIYSFGLRQLVHELHLGDVVQFVGRRDDGEVRALYEACTVYLCMSEHEGFCLPVIEAMHFGLPVIAYASSALPGTIGDGGILVSQKHPAELAELINSLVTDNALRQKVITAGRTRAQSLAYSGFEQHVAALFTRAPHPKASVA